MDIPDGKLIAAEDGGIATSRGSVAAARRGALSYAAVATLLLLAGLAVFHFQTPGGNTPPPPHCQITAHAQSELYPGYLHAGCANLTGDVARWHADCFLPGVSEWHPEGNVFVRLPDPAECAVATSEEWVIAGWRKRFVQLAPHQAFDLPAADQRHVLMYKLLRGSVLNVDTNGVQHADGSWETYPTTVPFGVKSIKIDRGVEKITAGSRGAVFAYYVVSHSTLQTVLKHGDMQNLSSPVYNISGPLSHLLQWRMFGTYECCKQYDGLPWWNLPGYFVQDHNLNRVVYIQLWTMEEGMDTGDYHDHSDEQGKHEFGELHAHMYTGTGLDGLQALLPSTVYTNSKPMPSSVRNDTYVVNGTHSTGWINWHDADDSVQLGIAIPAGYVHGPLWLIRSDGYPVMGGCNQSSGRRYIKYPMHRNLVGRLGPGAVMHRPPRLQMLIAFEHPKEHCWVPPSLLAQDNSIMKNAYVQSRDELGKYC
ncbi:hypothetical protein AB1Y20_009177 [Prymnesium parvum]|uniref:Aldos-2-ulose dehydratase/isomerase (AUDH) Cupin domain-containing protein n=1 Tax=Prymnesium parvum TaxID=97485 RepID=A0AB34K1F2_PRYPA